ncbi:hypothetical protein EVAR_86071_1 [Eumeta japonica]|uniref:Mos1 transposase HTH domain-containing protein n=1 Tax=Eumeta variegata TaxID=151549 RepID=A0A4C1UJG4_EUMVA|nr:hypothetical protein EVAR_86071_1 [Eumeta japonica]
MVFFYFTSSLSPQGCTTRLRNAFGRKTTHLSTVRRWYIEFDHGRVSLRDEVGEVRLSTVIIEKNVAIFRQLIEEKWCITYEEIREHLRIGDETRIYCYMPERKQQPSVWVFEGDSKRTKLRQARSIANTLKLRYANATDHYPPAPHRPLCESADRTDG